jgi:hypothetical protein
MTDFMWMPFERISRKNYLFVYPDFFYNKIPVHLGTKVQTHCIGADPPLLQRGEISP